MWYIFNLTRDTRREHDSKSWPEAESLVKDGFAVAGDVLELIEMDTKHFSFRGIKYVKQQPYTYGTQRINPEGTDFNTLQQRVSDWLSEQIHPTETTLPIPKCGKCQETFTDIANAQSIRDANACLKCLAKRFGNKFVPKKKKSS